MRARISRAEMMERTKHNNYVFQNRTGIPIKQSITFLFIFNCLINFRTLQEIPFLHSLLVQLDTFRNDQAFNINVLSIRAYPILILLSHKNNLCLSSIQQISNDELMLIFNQ